MLDDSTPIEFRLARALVNATSHEYPALVDPDCIPAVMASTMDPVVRFEGWHCNEVNDIHKLCSHAVFPFLALTLCTTAPYVAIPTMLPAIQDGKFDFNSCTSIAPLTERS
jgi:hypothetical protein